jgi:hypothetical protein
MAAQTTPDYGPWNHSADRAIAVRQILEEEGLPAANPTRWQPRPIPILCFRTILYRSQSARHDHSDA